MWGLVAFASDGTPSQFALIPGAFGPPLAATVLVAASDRGLRPWLAARFRWRLAPRWYLLALGLPLLLVGAIAGGVVLAGGTLDPSVLGRRLPTYPILLLFTALLSGGQEELGWRGFAQPHLETRFDGLTASLLVGALWALWHLPLFPLGLARNATGSFAIYAALVLAFAVVLAGLTHASGGSILPAILLHAGVNTSGALVPASAAALEQIPLALDLATTAGIVALAIATVALGGVRGPWDGGQTAPQDERTAGTE